MFTGIVSDVGRLRVVEGEAERRLVIETGYDTGEIAIGASIACAGVCLTVVETGADWFAVDVSPETLGCTTLGEWRAGRRINLERALRLGDELGGHLVLGHVDGIARVVGREPAGASQCFAFAAPAPLARFIAEKGSVALDGVSLTVNRVAGERFEIMLIPHTLAETTLGALDAGDAVNLEVDVLARYVARLNARGEP